MSSADSAKGLCPLDSRSSPEGRPPQTAPKGSALWTPAPRRRGVLRRQRQRAPPSGLPLLAGEASSADSAKGLRPLDSHAPPGLLRLRAGRELNSLPPVAALLTGPPEQLRAGRYTSLSMIDYSGSSVNNSITDSILFRKPILKCFQIVSEF